MLRRSIVLAAAFVALAGAAAPALADTSVLFGNTLQVTHGGKTAKIYVDQGGTYTQAKADGTTASGSWAEKGGKLCLTQAKPQAAAERCMPAITTQGVGDSWSVGPGGEMQMSIVEGR